jgi:hypothetical protein
MVFASSTGKLETPVTWKDSVSPLLLRSLHLAGLWGEDEGRKRWEGRE